MIAEATGATEEAAIAALHDLIDARENRRANGRRDDSRAGVAVPSTEEYVEAIRHIGLSRSQCAMLTALSLAGDDGLTLLRMADAAGYKSGAAANRSFLAAGLLIANCLSVETPSHATSGDPEYAAILGYRRDETGNWILHPELREAVRLAL